MSEPIQDGAALEEGRLSDRRRPAAVPWRYYKNAAAPAAASVRFAVGSLTSLICDQPLSRPGSHLVPGWAAAMAGSGRHKDEGKNDAPPRLHSPRRRKTRPVECSRLRSRMRPPLLPMQE